MKIKKPDTAKSIEALNELKQKSVEIGKKTAGSVQAGTKALIDKSKNEAYLKRLKHYNPLFPEVYQSEEYHIPNIIKIVDDAERKGIDVCEGAIGWTGKSKDVEILYLYDEAVDFSGLTFLPSAICDSVYYRDNFDKSIYIRTDSLFQRTHEEKLAELEHIASSLGAKSFYVDMQITKKEFKFSKMKQNTTAEGYASENIEQESSADTGTVLRGISKTEYVGSNIPRMPNLKWFKHDKNIANLIDSRLNNTNDIKSKYLKLTGSSVSTMSQNTAAGIDAAVKNMGVKVNASGSMEKQVKTETKYDFIFYIEF